MERSNVSDTRKGASKLFLHCTIFGLALILLLISQRVSSVGWKMSNLGPDLRTPIDSDTILDVINVYQGNSVILKCPSQDTWKIFDAGSKGNSARALENVVEALHYIQTAQSSSKNISIFITHPHTDHYSHFRKVNSSKKLRLKRLNNTRVSLPVMQWDIFKQADWYVTVDQSNLIPLRTPKGNASNWALFERSIPANKLTSLSGPNIRSFGCGTNSLLSYIPGQTNRSDPNSYSIISYFSINNKTLIILPGDAQAKDRLESLKAIRGQLPLHSFENIILLLAHHGSRAHSDSDWLEEIDALAKNNLHLIISAGHNRIYWHPRCDMMEDWLKTRDYERQSTGNAPENGSYNRNVRCAFKDDQDKFDWKVIDFKPKGNKKLFFHQTNPILKVNSSAPKGNNIRFLIKADGSIEYGYMVSH